MLRARVYTENYIGVCVYENYGTIVGGSYVYRLAIVQRSFNDCSTIVKLRRTGNFLMTDTVLTLVYVTMSEKIDHFALISDIEILVPIL